MMNKTNFGIFIELEDGIEGLLHKSKLNHNKSIDRLYNEDKFVMVKIESINKIKRQISFSIPV